jgi:hypothetical protein
MNKFLLEEIARLSGYHVDDICIDQCAFADRIGWRASIEIGGNVVVETTLYQSDEEALKALIAKYVVE